MVRIVAPGATEQELAAILAAYEALWPKSSMGVEAPVAPTAWRFSGRWWQSGPFGCPEAEQGLGGPARPVGSGYGDQATGDGQLGPADSVRSGRRSR